MFILVIGVFVLFVAAVAAMLHDVACASKVIAPTGLATMCDGMPGQSWSGVFGMRGIEQDSSYRNAEPCPIGEL